MIINEELFALEDQAEQLVATIVKSKSFADYQKADKELKEDKEAQKLKAEFQQAKQTYEQVAEYGAFRPEVRDYQRAAGRAKRKLDFHEKVAEFRLQETNVQEILDSVCLTLAETISDEIKVDAGNPFFQTGKSHCGGKCHG